jgi:hypothetical protein
VECEEWKEWSGEDWTKQKRRNRNKNKRAKSKEQRAKSKEHAPSEASSIVQKTSPSFSTDSEKLSRAPDSFP